MEECALLNGGTVVYIEELHGFPRGGRDSFANWNGRLDDLRSLHYKGNYYRLTAHHN